jgi:tetratricopeptide (TPR) repeat protein
LSVSIVVLLLVAGVWWSVRGRQQERAVATDSLIVALRVDGGFETSLERGEPLLFEVFLQGRTDTASATLGSAATPWHRLVSLRRDREVALGEAVVLGRPRMTGIALDGGRASLLADEDAAIARIVGRHRTYSVALGFGPEVTSALPAGRQTITAAIGAVTSVPVSVIVTEPTTERELERLRRSASFSVRAGRYEAGKTIAEAVLARQADDVAAHTAVGDALKGLGRPLEARAAYLKALESLRSSRQFYEEPESLFARIRQVERELGAARR